MKRRPPYFFVQIRWTDFALPLLASALTVGIGLIIHLDQKHGLPGAEQLQYLDPGWYKAVMENGYEYKNDGANNTAFFPLFPYLWRAVGGGLITMSVINGLFFALASGLLLRGLRAPLHVKAFATCLSILLFYVTPYSESLFFVFGALMLTGLRRERHWAILTSVVG